MGWISFAMTAGFPAQLTLSYQCHSWLWFLEVFEVLVARANPKPNPEIKTANKLDPIYTYTYTYTVALIQRIKGFKILQTVSITNWLTSIEVNRITRVLIVILIAQI